MKTLIARCLAGIKDKLASTSYQPAATRTFEVITLTTKEDLLDLGELRRVEKVLGKQVGSKMTVMQLIDNSYAILVLPDYVHSGLLDDVYAECQHKLRGRLAVYAVDEVVLRSLMQVSKEQAQAHTRAHSNSDAVFDLVVAYSLENLASDITVNVHLDQPLSQVSFQIDGVYVHPARWLLPTDQVQGMLRSAWQKIKGGSSSTLIYTVQLQGLVTIDVRGQKIALRWMSMSEDRGVSVTLRVAVEGEVSKLDDLGYLDDHLQAFRRSQASAGGLVGVAGRVGSGKTRLTSAMLGELPDTWKIIEIGDPIEIRQARIIQTTVEKRIDGSSAATFASKVAAFKRSAPNAVSLGEIGDELTGRGVIEGGGMGTKCYFTVHAMGQVNVPERLADNMIKIPRDFLAAPGMLRLIVYQALTPKLCSCALKLSDLHVTGGIDCNRNPQPPAYWQRYSQRLSTMFAIDASRLRIRNPDGCEECRHPEFHELNGYQGRTPILEYMEPNSDYRILKCIAQGDALALQQLLNSLPRDDNDQPGMRNKNISECAIYKSLRGEIDPRDIEKATESFESLASTERYLHLFQETSHEPDPATRPPLAAVASALPLQSARQ
ncbi:ATPase, T2SS/T4P/T4SS family [Pseudomonas helleri]|uniref:ATPase, T2SS/T4P/T4SS family n=1 Tax=Pseudomonas helleri TaxID=1608996 RepID=UPI003FD2C663